MNQQPKRKRATRKEKQRRLSRIIWWIEWDELTDFKEAVALIMEEFGVGRRQAIRYYVEARALTLDERTRSQYESYGNNPGRGPGGRLRARYW